MARGPRVEGKGGRLELPVHVAWIMCIRLTLNDGLYVVVSRYLVSQSSSRANCAVGVGARLKETSYAFEMRKNRVRNAHPWPGWSTADAGDVIGRQVRDEGVAHRRHEW